MKVRIAWLVSGFLIVLSVIAMASCAPRLIIDPNATPIAVMDGTIQGFDQTQQALEVIRMATIAYYGTQSAGLSNPLTAIPAPANEAVFVAVNADCRSGPGTEYGVVISLYAGESAVLFGVDAGGSWFYIEALDSVRCWILSSLVFAPGGTPLSAAGNIPVLPPPPTPVFTLTPTLIPTPVNIGTPAP